MSAEKEELHPLIGSDAEKEEPAVSASEHLRNLIREYGPCPHSDFGRLVAWLLD